MRKCTKCGKEKPATIEYFRRNRNGLRGECKDCSMKYSSMRRLENANRQKEYYASHKEYYSQMNKKYHKLNGKRRHQELKRGVVEYYGGKCECCNEDRIEFLNIDHINGGGNSHRSLVGRGRSFYCWLKKNGFPPGFRVLCFNCNFAKYAYGKCPHQIEGKL